MNFGQLLRLLCGGVVGVGLLLACSDREPVPGEEGRTSVSVEQPPVGPPFGIRSVTLDARHPPEPDLLLRLRELGITHITLCSFGWQETADTPRIRVDTSDGWYSESHRGIRTLARQADSMGMGVILKPHIWVGGYDDEEMNRSEIGFNTESAWARWERNYRRFLIVYARLADEVNADVLVLGTELSRAAKTRPDYWRALADTVRTVYDGRLTYAANWHAEYQEIAFWDALDYVGVQAYFPLSDHSDPSLETLKERWKAHRQSLAKMHKRSGRPILFTEVGYRSARSAAEQPWLWPERERNAAPADSALQARCYRAFLSTMHDASWFAGAVIWKWHPAYEDSRPTAFTPQGKPAEAVLRRWFTRDSRLSR